MQAGWLAKSTHNNGTFMNLKKISPMGAAVLKVQTWILQKVVYDSPKDSLLKGNVNSFIKSIDKISTVKPL